MVEQEKSQKMNIPPAKIVSKPVPQLLDEIDDNIRSAAEAARKAEESAKAAKEVAIQATKASAEAEKRAEEARQAGQLAAQTATKAAAEAGGKAERIAREAMLIAKEALRKVTEAEVSTIGTKKYLVVYEKVNKNYSAYLPDIPGCIATGKTREETEKNIKEAISFHIQGLKEDGLPLPKPSSFPEYVEV